MKKIILVSCVSQKVEGTAKAANLYISDWFNKAKAYAKATGCDWYILSAKYGLLHPETSTPTYEATLNDMSKLERAEWALNVAKRLRIVAPAGSTIEILAGRNYRIELCPLLVSSYSVNVPLAGLGIGSQKKRLMELVRELAE